MGYAKNDKCVHTLVLPFLIVLILYLLFERQDLVSDVAKTHTAHRKTQLKFSMVGKLRIIIGRPKQLQQIPMHINT